MVNVEAHVAYCRMVNAIMMPRGLFFLYEGIYVVNDGEENTARLAKTLTSAVSFFDVENARDVLILL